MADDIKYKVFKALSRNLSVFLEQRRMTQAQLASKVKMNKSTLHGYVNGAVPSGIVSLKKIANLFGVSLDELIFGEQTDRVEQKTTELERFEITIKKI